MSDFVFNDTTYAQHGLIQECEDITGLGAGNISGNTSRMKTFARRLSMAKSRFFTLAFAKDELWNFDDRGYADSEQELPIATTNVVSGTGDYRLDEDFLVGSQFFIKDPSGEFQELTPQEDRSEPSAYLTQVSGVPTKYELIGNSIILDKIPNYNSTAGLKVVFKRNGKKFAHGDGAVPIGVPSLFFEYLANYASKPFITKNGIRNAAQVAADIIRDEAAIMNFISNRAKPKRSGLRPKQESNK